MTDFKPDNVLLDAEQQAHVADFGLACLNDQEPRVATAPTPTLDELPARALNTPLTAAGAISGTPGYMSPEQYRGATVDSRSDQFSFCVALYEALYQQLPFSGTTLAELAANTTAGRLRPPPASSQVPDEIRGALKRGLAVAPEDRFPSMAELLAALELTDDPARSRVTRQRISVVLLIGCAILALVAQSSKRALAPPDLVLLSAATVGMVGIICLVFWRALRRHTLVRSLMATSIISLVTVLTVRIVGWRLGLRTQQIMPIDLAVMGGMFGMIAYHQLQGLWWVVLGLTGAAVAEILQPDHVEQITKSVYAVLPFVVTAVWMHTAQQTPRHPAESAPLRPSSG